MTKSTKWVPGGTTSQIASNGKFNPNPKALASEGKVVMVMVMVKDVVEDGAGEGVAG